MSTASRTRTALSLRNRLVSGFGSAAFNQVAQLVLGGHQLIERNMLVGRVLRAATVHQAAIARHLVEPYRERPRTVELGQVGKQLAPHVLHGVFGVLAMAADLHAEGVDGVLQQGERLLDSLGAVLADELQRLLQFGGHGDRLAEAAAEAKSEQSATCYDVDEQPVDVPPAKQCVEKRQVWAVNLYTQHGKPLPLGFRVERNSETKAVPATSGK